MYSSPGTPSGTGSSSRSSTSRRRARDRPADGHRAPRRQRRAGPGGGVDRRLGRAVDVLQGRTRELLREARREVGRQGLAAGEEQPQTGGSSSSPSCSRKASSMRRREVGDGHPLARHDAPRGRRSPAGRRAAPAPAARPRAGRRRSPRSRCRRLRGDVLEHAVAGRQGEAGAGARAGCYRPRGAETITPLGRPVEPEV